jgi:uncharacterized membrane protein required for colicin V production
VVTLFWLYRGLKVGAYAAMNVAVAFLLALLVTLNYYDALMPVVGKVAPRSDRGVRLSVSVITIYCLALALFGYLVMAFCVERIHIHRHIDRVAGTILGLATGVLCSAALLFMWFSLPFAEEEFPVDDSNMFFPAHQLTFKAINVVHDRMDGGQPFEGSRFFRDLRHGLPRLPETGQGFYVTSVPTGLEVYVDSQATRAENFFDTIIARYDRHERQWTYEEKRRAFTRAGRTPVWVNVNKNAAFIAVVREGLPRDLRSLGVADRYRPDGEVAVAERVLGDDYVHFKIYRASREDPVGSLVSLFRRQSDIDGSGVRNMLPLKVCFTLTESSVEELRKELILNRATETDLERMIPQLRLGGKALFIGAESKPMAVEMTGRNAWRIYEVPQPEVLE